MACLRDRLLAVKDFTLTPLEVPEWGETVFIKSLSVGDARKFADGNETNIFQMLVSSLHDEQGEPLFTMEDVPFFESRSPKAIERISEAILEANGLNEDADEDAKKN